MSNTIEIIEKMDENEYTNNRTIIDLNLNPNSLDKIVLLCCTGRSGSTTLQRIMNSIPNSNICGENYGAINSLLLFYKKLKQTTFLQVHGQKKPISYEMGFFI